MLESKILTHRGAVRDVNEDCIAEDLARGFWVLADGVGGAGNGDVASQICVQVIERSVRQGDSLQQALLNANQALLDAAQANPELEGMCSTAIVCRFDAGHFELAWVGDSRAYLVNNQGIVQLTRDHSLANALRDQGELSEAQVQSQSRGNELAQALGQLDLASIPRSLGELHDGESLLLCTDGLSGVLLETELASLMQSGETLDNTADKLLNRVLEEGAPDNVTFALVRYKLDEPKIRARDFQKSKGYRAPFDRRPYEKNLRWRPYVLVIILLSLFALFVLI